MPSAASVAWMPWPNLVEVERQPGSAYDSPLQGTRVLRRRWGIAWLKRRTARRGPPVTGAPTGVAIAHRARLQVLAKTPKGSQNSTWAMLPVLAERQLVRVGAQIVAFGLFHPEIVHGLLKRHARYR